MGVPGSNLQGKHRKEEKESVQILIYRPKPLAKYQSFAVFRSVFFFFQRNEGFKAKCNPTVVHPPPLATVFASKGLFSVEGVRRPRAALQFCCVYLCVLTIHHTRYCRGTR